MTPPPPFRKPKPLFDSEVGYCPFMNDTCRRDCVFHSNGSNVNVNYTECLIMKAITKIIYGV
jgi:hypothetical protein